MAEITKVCSCTPVLLPDDKEKLMFVDLEWNRYGRIAGLQDEVLEVGTTTFLGGQKNVSFYILKPTRGVTEKTKIFLGLTSRQLNNGESREKVIKDFVEKMSISERVIIWSGDAKDMLVKMCEEYSVSICTDRIFVLQDFFSNAFTSGRRISFERAVLSYVSDAIPARFHDAGYDSECLGELYNVFAGAEKDGGSGYDKIINYDATGEKAAALAQVRNLVGQAVSSDEFKDIAAFFNMGCREVLGFYEVNTEYSRWKVYVSEGFVSSLFHENYKGKERKGYHHHNIEQNDAFSVLRYIAVHDKNIDKKTIAEDYRRDYEKKMKKTKMQKEKRLFSC